MRFLRHLKDKDEFEIVANDVAHICSDEDRGFLFRRGGKLHCPICKREFEVEYVRKRLPR